MQAARTFVNKNICADGCGTRPKHLREPQHSHERCERCGAVTHGAAVAPSLKLDKWSEECSSS